MARAIAGTAGTAAYDALAVGRRGRLLTPKLAVYVVLTLFALYYAIPLMVLITNSFRDQEEITRTSLLGLPRTFNLDYWRIAWSEACIGGRCAGIAPYFWNSFKMVVPATIISTAIGLLNGYALSKWRFKGHQTLFAIIMVGVFIPGQIMLLPWAITLGTLGLTNTTAGLVLVHTVQGLAFTTLFCRNYLLSVPDELIKAARIDGAGFLKIFRRIIVPLSPPILIVTIIWQFTHIWNEFLFGVTFSSGANQPITAALIALAASGTTERYYNIESAAVIAGALPTLAIYFFGGKWFVRGLTAGAIKT